MFQKERFIIKNFYLVIYILKAIFQKIIKFTVFVNEHLKNIYNICLIPIILSIWLGISFDHIILTVENLMKLKVNY